MGSGVFLILVALMKLHTLSQELVGKFNPFPASHDLHPLLRLSAYYLR